MPTLYGHPLSPFVRKAKLVLLEKGIEHEHEHVMPTAPFNNTPEFLAMSPLGKVPAYKDGDFAIADSSVIVQYLEQVQPKPAVLPADAKERARALMIEEYCDTRVIETIGALFQQRVVLPRFLGQEPDASRVEELLAALPDMLQLLEDRLSGGGDGWALASGFSLADVAVACDLRQLELAGEPLDADGFPKLTRLFEAMQQRSSYQKNLAVETAALQG